ncbi:MAG: UbiA-like polyprenyltransferase [Coriobacteriales bacterium]|nr:putative 4-hydroxybenzoate polyprenyltransferase [Actinomycetes bacterium]
MSKIIQKIKVLLELVKFEHSIFALPYAYIGALYGAQVAPWTTAPARGSAEQGHPWWVMHTLDGPGWPSWPALVWITVVMVGARSFAFVINRAVDREIDARNPRTAGRAIPAGRVTAWELWIFSAIMLAAYLFGVWQLHPVTRWLWPIPLVAFIVYPYLKRVTPFCHYWLGLCLGLAPIGGWLAVGGPATDAAPWVFGCAVMLWTVGFDIIYATQDIACDVRDGLHSMPVDFGLTRALTQARLKHVSTVALLVLGGFLVGAGWPWYIAVGAAAALMWYEHSIVSPEDLSRVNEAFFTVNGIVAIVVFTGALADRLRGGW